MRGDKGTMKIDRGRLAIYAEDSHNSQPEMMVVSERDGTLFHVENFLDCVKTRKSPNSNIEIGFEAARASWIGNIALKRGMKTVWDAAAEKVAS